MDLSTLVTLGTYSRYVKYSQYAQHVRYVRHVQYVQYIHYVHMQLCTYVQLFFVVGTLCLIPKYLVRSTLYLVPSK